MTKKFSAAHFHPYSLWAVDTQGPRFYNNEAKFIIDSRTGDKYLNEDLATIRYKCFLLSLGTPLVHAIAAIIKVIFNLLKLAFLYDFWKTADETNKENKAGYHFTNRALDAGTNLLHIAFTPIAILLLECSALYGIIMPRNGRKLYANLERFTYGDFVLAPCFQPEPEAHLLGGDIGQQNAF